MTLEPFKYLIQPVALVRDGDRIIEEKVAQVATAYSVEQAVEAMRAFERELALLNEREKEEGHEPDGNEDNGRAQAVPHAGAPGGGLRQS